MRAGLRVLRLAMSTVDSIATGEAIMLKLAIIFFIVSVVAGLFGFTGVASGTRTIAKVLFYVAITIFLVVLVFGVLLGVLVF